MSRNARYSFQQFNADYPDDNACLDALFKQRYGNMPVCYTCGVVKPRYYRVKGRKCYACIDCRHQLHPTAGTIYHKSPTPLKTWFTALYLFSVSKNGVSALELQRMLGVTYKIAWRMAKQIRSAMKQDGTLLQGVVEADEAYIGGRRRSSNRFKNKTPLLGAVERNGRARVVALNDFASSTSVTNFLINNVQIGTTLQTDESALYARSQKMYQRRKVNHSRFEFVQGQDYTNTIEGFWGLLKPSLNGTHRSVSKKYLQLYVNEAVWRYNHRQHAVQYPLLWQRLRSQFQ